MNPVLGYGHKILLYKILQLFACLGIMIGAIIGVIISWLIFNSQKKTSDKQDYTLNRIEHLEKYNEKLLEKILELNRKIDSLLEG